MMMQKTYRKARPDRMHAVYVITNVVTGEQYVGITVASGNLRKCLKVRMQKHIRRALTENKDWALCRSIREHGVGAFTYGVLETLRGRKAAHQRERELIRLHQPALNTF
ncbi:MAG: GIY-YIG nuclease family protein [Fischerella sp.]|nr:GIY-YIG nuclease family protein [Fischerella sp.]